MILLKGKVVNERIETFPAAALETINVTMRFEVNGVKKMVLDNINFTAQRGEFTCIVGQSGCGKTTLLNILAGFITPSSGLVRVQGRQICKPGPDRCVVFQENTLFPWLTVSENIAFGLREREKNKRELREEVNRFLSLVGLRDYRHYLPRDLSGGMKQRVELARVLILKPHIILMDEPFVSLDYRTRREMQDLLISLWQELSQTIIFVTHDVDEAITLAGKIEIMDINPGTIAEELHISQARPRNVNQAEYAFYRDRIYRSLWKSPVRTAEEAL